MRGVCEGCVRGVRGVYGDVKRGGALRGTSTSLISVSTGGTPTWAERGV